MARYTEFNVNAQDHVQDQGIVIRRVETSYSVYGLNNSTWENLPGNRVNYDSLEEVAGIITRNAENPDDPIVRSINCEAGKVKPIEGSLTVRVNKSFIGVSRRTLTRDEGIDLARRIRDAREK
ncbi:hypothetical protein HY500_01240 [Candidatus Woesearchaeota archaeon]|nr:hypothetical protein [Candidatus Woesearchaeota archaeon]